MAYIGKIAAYVLLKMFISCNERLQTTDAPSARAELYFQIWTTYNSLNLVSDSD